MTDITLTPAAAAIVKSEIARFGTDRLNHKKYATEMNVTAETVAEHVAIFRDAYRAAKPKVTGDEVKAFATKIRNGLNRVLDVKPESTPPTALITSLGAAATIEEVIAAWESAQK